MRKAPRLLAQGPNGCAAVLVLTPCKQGFLCTMGTGVQRAPGADSGQAAECSASSTNWEELAS
jgi:hypothetical protein